MTQILLGQTLHFSGDPFSAPFDEVAHHDRRGAVAFEDGKISYVGPAENAPNGDVTDFGYIIPKPQ